MIDDQHIQFTYDVIFAVLHNYHIVVQIKLVYVHHISINYVEDIIKSR